MICLPTSSVRLRDAHRRRRGASGPMSIQLSPSGLRYIPPRVRAVGRVSDLRSSMLRPLASASQNVRKTKDGSRGESGESRHASRRVAGRGRGRAARPHVCGTAISTHDGSDLPPPRAQSAPRGGGARVRIAGSAYRAGRAAPGGDQSVVCGVGRRRPSPGRAAGGRGGASRRCLAAWGGASADRRATGDVGVVLTTLAVAPRRR